VNFVVDASVAAKWFLDEHDSEAAISLLTSATALVAPEIILVEVTNVVWKKWRRGEVQRHHLHVPARWLETGLPRLVPIRDILDKAIRLTAELDHPIYDCLYLALASDLDFQLITADRRLQARTAGTRLAPLVRTLADIPTF